MDTARFCRKCGEGVSGQQVAEESEEETRVVSRRGEDVEEEKRRKGEEGKGSEVELFSISPTLFFVNAGYVAAALGALILVGLTSAFLWNFVSVGVSVLVGLMLLLVPAFYHVRQKLLRYKLTENTLEIDSGFISRTTRNVPLRRIQDVTVSATPWQRLFGIGDLIIDNASEEGGKVVLKNINSPKFYADQLLGQMRRLEK